MTEDQELMLRLRDGDIDALEQLIDRWRAKAEAYARGMLHDPQAAEDAVQEAFSRIYAARRSLDAKSSFSAYLYTIVKRICIDEIRKRKRFPELPGEMPEELVDSAESEYIGHLERLEKIHALAGLDFEDRRILLAFSLENRPTKAIAEELGMTDGQVRVRLHRIRKRLRRELKKHES